MADTLHRVREREIASTLLKKSISHYIIHGFVKAGDVKGYFKSDLLKLGSRFSPHIACCDYVGATYVLNDYLTYANRSI